MRTILYLIDQPLDERNYERFGIQAWKQRGWEVEVWDLTPLSYPRVWQAFIESGHKLQEFAGYFPVASKSHLEQRLSALPRIEYFIDLTLDSYYSIRAKLSLAQKGAKRVICATGSIPEPDRSQENGLASRFRLAFGEGTIKGFRRLANGLVRRLAAPRIRPGVVVVSGEKSMAELSAGQEGEILRAHNLDYDIYLSLGQSARSPAREYAVFLDQDYCFHRDFVYGGIPSPHLPDRYFPAICNGLRKVSEALEVDLRIAAHPRSSYRERVPDYFEGIPIEYGRTAELIRDSKVAVCHDSTALQFAVLFEKPLIFFTTDDLEASVSGPSIAVFASELGKSVINVDRDLGSVDWRRELSVDSQKYAAYRNKYIKMEGSSEMPHWDIVIDHIDKAAVQRGDSIRSASVPS